MEHLPVAVLPSSRLVELLSSQNIGPTDYRPAYGGESVGLDLYCTAEPVLKQIVGEEFTTNIDVGIRVVIPRGYVGLIMDRGSIGKTALTRRAGVIDPGYTGPVFANLFGSHQALKKIAVGDKLPVQLVIVACNTAFDIVDADHFDQITQHSARKEGAIGSSDK